MEATTNTGTVARSVQTGPDLEEMIQITALLKDQRKAVVDDLVSDIPAYLTYRFAVTATLTQRSQIGEALLEYCESTIPSDACKTAAAEGRRGVAATGHPDFFYREIDKIIDAILHPAQLELGIFSGTSKNG